MTTKKEIIVELTQLGIEYLGHAGLCWDTYMRLKKSELLIRLETAKEMIVIKRESLILKEKHSPMQWKVAVIFPQDMPKELLEDIREYNHLSRKASDLWLKV